MPALSCASIASASSLPSLRNENSLTLPTLSSAPVREVAQDQVGAARAFGASPPPAPPPRRARRRRPPRPPPPPPPPGASGPKRCSAIQRRRLAGEREPPDLRVFLLLAAREVHDRDARLDRPALPLQPLRRRARRIGRERRPLPVVGKRERGRRAAGRAAAAAAAASGAATSPIGKRSVLSRADRLDDDLGVPFLRREPIAEPLAVVRQHRGAERLPRDRRPRLRSAASAPAASRAAGPKSGAMTRRRRRATAAGGEISWSYLNGSVHLGPTTGGGPHANRSRGVSSYTPAGLDADAPYLQRHLRFSACCLAAASSAGRATSAAPPKRELVRVFLDCDRCDDDYVRKEVTFVDYVRNREDSDVHVLVTTAGHRRRRDAVDAQVHRPRAEPGIRPDAHLQLAADRHVGRSARPVSSRSFKVGLVRYAATTRDRRSAAVTLKKPEGTRRARPGQGPVELLGLSRSTAAATSTARSHQSGRSVRGSFRRQPHDGRLAHVARGQRQLPRHQVRAR